MRNVLRSVCVCVCLLTMGSPARADDPSSGETLELRRPAERARSEGTLFISSRASFRFLAATAVLASAGGVYAIASQAWAISQDGTCTERSAGICVRRARAPAAWESALILGAGVVELAIAAALARLLLRTRVAEEISLSASPRAVNLGWRRSF